MNKILIILSLVLLAACGPSQEEKQNIAQNACSIMGETKKSDSLFRTQTMIDAREKIGGGAFVRGDDAIIEAFEFGVCQQLVLNESYDETLQPLKDAKQERERIAAEKRAEEQRIADSKPTVKEEFFSNGQLKSRTNYQPKSDGGKEHGLSVVYHENGQLWKKGNYKDGGEDGLWELYDKKGTLYETRNYKDGGNSYIGEEYYKNVLERRGNFAKNGYPIGLVEQFYGRNTSRPEDKVKLMSKTNYKDGGLKLYESYYTNGQLKEKGNYKDQEKDGLWELYNEDGLLYIKRNYKDGKQDGLYEEYKYEDGKHFVSWQGNYKDGKQDGIFKRQYSDGDVIEECYKATYRNGRQRLDMSNCTE